MEYIRYIIIGGKIPDKFWPKIFLVITYIFNLLLILLLNDIYFL